jgi:peptide chain release factor 3
VFRIGDTLTTQKGIVFQELPTFAPELFGQIMMKHALKHKAFTKGVAQLCEEGTVQLLRTVQTGDLILGVLGTLQFEVFLYRMKHEYGVDVDVQRLPFQIARWVVGDRVDASDFRVNSMLCTDKLGQTVALFDSEYALLSAKERLGSVQFLETAPA